MALTELNIISWNIMMYVKFRPERKHVLKNIIEALCDLKPNVLCLQESSDWANELISTELKMVIVGSELTHGGLCTTFVSPNLKVVDVKKYSHTGVVCTIENFGIVMNCHLTPYYKNHAMRISQLRDMFEHIQFEHIQPKLGQTLVLVGDFNMCEDQNISQDILNTYKLKDIAHEHGNLAPTWFKDFHEKGSTISKRYDRIYSNVETESQHAIHMKLKGLSDHIPIGISTSI
jgi:endonuclease/exonuclease/phosphatase family metal-dependent hydrolase